MRITGRLAAALTLLALLVMAACATTEMTASQAYAGPALPRPDRIIVYDFGATPGEVAPDSGLAAQAPEAAPQTPEEIDQGRKMAAAVARQLTADLQEMGLPAVQAAGQPPPRPGDILIKGNFYSVDEGSATKRVLVGFGSGAADLKTAVDVYHVTPEGPQRLGGGAGTAEAGKTPGMILPILMFAATKNPIGLIVVGAMKAHGEASGSSTVDGDAKRTADAIAARLKIAATKQGWI